LSPQDAGWPSPGAALGCPCSTAGHGDGSDKQGQDVLETLEEPGLTCHLKGGEMWLAMLFFSISGLQGKIPFHGALKACWGISVPKSLSHFSKKYLSPWWGGYLHNICSLRTKRHHL